MSRVTRRDLLRGLGAAALGSPLAALLPAPAARAAAGRAERVLFFYFPDGVPGPSQSGQASAWHVSGPEFGFSLSPCLEPLAGREGQCVFFSGLSMGPTDSGSHPGGARKLLTAADYGNNESIDQYLARTVGADRPWRHLLLGAQANANGASGDKHISYPSAGFSLPPQDNPRQAFQDLFGAGAAAAPGRSAPPVDGRRLSVIDTVLGDVERLKSQLGGLEALKLDRHLEALREVEARVAGIPGGGGEVLDPASCEDPAVDTSGFTDGELYAPEAFPAILKAQIDVMVLAMACGRTRVGTLQASQHTSELIMSRFPGTPMHDPGWDMRSHQASHYGASHGGREYDAFFLQRQWWVSQFRYLLDQLAATPEGDGNMLDNSLVVLCTEVCDGNTHFHDDMPFVLAGGGGGRIRTGRRHDAGFRRHGDLWIALANAMGDGLSRFGDASAGPLPGLLA